MNSGLWVLDIVSSSIAHAEKIFIELMGGDNCNNSELLNYKTDMFI